MTDAGASTGVGWWPTLVLWGTVIAVGSLYLWSVEQHREEAAPGMAGQATTLTAPGADKAGIVAREPLPVAAPGPAIEAPPMPAAPPAGQSASRPASRPADQVQAAAQVTVAIPTSPAAEPPAQAPAPEPSGTAPQPAAAAEVSPMEARAFASAVTETPPAGQGPAPTPIRTPTQTPTHTLGEDERARILAEYEALRRAAEADQGPRGGRGQPPGPYGARPYGQPRGYPSPLPYAAPGSATGYAPAYPAR